MAILKQNGANGKILRSNDGSKVMKQNYNFARGYKGISSNPIEFNDYIGESFPTTGSFEFWVNHDVKLTTGEVIEITNNDGTPSNLLRVIFEANDGGRINFIIGNTSFNNRSFGTVYRTHFLIKWANGLANMYANGIKLNTSGDISFSLPVNLSIGKFNSCEQPLIRVIDDLRFWDRELSDNDMIYNYNKGLGNEPLNLNNLRSWHKLDFCEDINSLPSVADYTGNYPGTITNLPAGTLQEQIDYANANLFLTW